MSEKKILMVVEPNDSYVDSVRETWTLQPHLSFASCENCGKGGKDTPLYDHQDNIVALCRDCVKVVRPREMFKQYEAAGRLPEVLERFTTTLINCEAEFKRHLAEKGETWLQGSTDWLFGAVQRASAKLLLADNGFQLDKTIDLILWAMMLAERDLRDADKDEDDIPF